MSITRKILIKIFVKPFYRQHAGLFVFLFIILFGAVGMVDGAGLMAFHLSLVQGMLKNIYFLLLVFFIWSLYAKKSEQYIGNILRRPDYLFLHMLSQIKSRKLFWQMVWIQFLLFLPVTVYLVIIFAAGIYLHIWLNCLPALFFLVALILVCAWWNVYQIKHPGQSGIIKKEIITFRPRETSYWSLVIRYIWKEKKLLFAGMKIYNCVILYEMVINQTKVEYDLSMIWLFFSFGILSHGLLIYQLRNMEETRLTFYRTVPRSLLNRFLQYALIYLILLVPEFITILTLVPFYLHFSDAILFILFSYSLLLFLNSLLFIQFFKIKDYLKIILCIFLLIYFCVLTVSIPVLCFFLFLSSIGIFQKRYYQFER